MTSNARNSGRTRGYGQGNGAAPATYGYIWSDWLYGAGKDAFVIDVYDACAAIDREPDVKVKGEKMAALQRWRPIPSSTAKPWCCEASRNSNWFSRIGPRGGPPCRW